MEMQVIVGGGGLTIGGFGLSVLNVGVFVGPPYVGYQGWTNRGGAGLFSLSAGWFEIPADRKFVGMYGRSAWLKFEDSDGSSCIKLTFTLKNHDGTDDVSFVRELEDCDMTDLTPGGGFSFRVALFAQPK
jgi:hypothetical protein